MLPPFDHRENAAPREEIPARVLVVDDEPLTRWSICTALTAEGFDAVAAASAEEALRLAAKWPPPKVAVVGRELAGGNGQELLTQLAREYPRCQFVLMTTERRGGPAERLPQDRMALIAKPFDLATVTRLVRQLASAANNASPAQAS